MDIEAVRKRIRELVAVAAPEAIDLSRDILEHPETGFRETRTADLVSQWFTHHALPYKSGLAVTGVRADLTGLTTGPRVAVMGELDSLIVPGHPHGDPNNNFAHACGHHAQIGMMLAGSAALADPDIREHLGGSVAFLAVPAEEYIELEFRKSLVEAGQLEFMGGKAELVRLGVFDDIDLAMLTHASSNQSEGILAVESVNNGALAKEAKFVGIQAHAGSAPHRGINALQAATLAMAAINANRETFQDADSIRVHPIITKGGDVVNAVPAEVRMEMFVRGRSLEAIADADKKVERAIRAGALAVGASVEISTYAAYLPLKHDHELSGLFRSNAETIVGSERVTTAGPRGSSTDMGDLSHIMPTIQPYARGAVGTPHGADFVINDYEMAVTNPAAATALTVFDLLRQEGHGTRIVEKFQPLLSKESYLELQRGFSRTVAYQE